ncbi:MAG: DUF1844 domain-containing protein [Deltaproteobacteria bacterium]|nr:MAG: DUF1844 domain-containing protein [Deltaproteobacteria bacterium]
MAASSGGDRFGEMDFSTFLISLASNVSIHLDPTHKAYDVALAKQTIDILEMLRAKTAGNRTEEEERLIEGLLYQTRVAYVDAIKK